MAVHYPELPIKIRQCTDARHLSTFIFKNEEFLFVLAYLEQNGYLKFFEVNKKLIIFPNYSSITMRPTISKFSLMTRSSCRNYIKLHEIKRLVAQRLYQHSFILTRSGLVTIKSAFKNGEGGEFIYHIL